MKNKGDRPEQAASSGSSGQALRRRAEERAGESAVQMPENLEALSPEATRKLLHELRVHQIELEMQNEDLRQAQAELGASQARYFDLYDLAPVGFCTVSEKGLILEANLTAAGLLGVARGALVKQRFSMFILNEDQDLYYRHRKQLFETLSASSGQTGEPQACELRMMKKDGTVFWAHLEATVAQDPSTSSGQAAEGAPVSRVALSDITEYKRAEEALRANRRQLTDIIEFLPDATLAIDMQGRIIIWNKAIEAMTGIPAADIIGKGNHVYTIPFYGEARPQLMDLAFKDHEEIAARYPNLTREGKTLMAEVFCNALYNNKGAWVFAKASPLHDQAGNITGAIESIRDITSQKQAEEALRESEARFMDVLYASGDAILLIGENTFIDCNEATARMLGYATRAEFLQTHPSELSPPEQPDGRRSFEKADEMMRLAFKRGFNRFEWMHRRANGEDFPVEVSLTPIIRGGKTLLYCVWRDITERKQAEEEKSKLEAQLQQAQRMESVGRLAGGVAHDFNNMLGIILGHTELAIAQMDPAQPLFADLEQIRMAANRSADLTRQLLAYARKQTVAPKVLDLNETVACMLTMLARLIGEDIHLTWQPKANLWPVNVDPSQIDQILANLCVNARDSIADVGKITIETGNSTFDKDYCAAHASFVPGEYVVLAVSDSGCGMDKETLDKIFEPFFTTKEMGKGTGLGLATVYGMVKQNNGFISVHSEPGQGTTFKIYLPRHVDKAPPVQQETSAEPSAHGQETILLVEDEPALLAMTTIILETQGYSVLTASTPGEAIRLAGERAGEIHLLMTDVVMPEMNGRDLAKNLLSLYPHLKCLFMSGYTADVIAHHGVLDKELYFIQKPFSMKELGAAVREALGQEETTE
jgi:two-component system, cell cycle sensor histidine kinase and response regulator CckA